MVCANPGWDLPPSTSIISLPPLQRLQIGAALVVSISAATPPPKSSVSQPATSEWVCT